MEMKETPDIMITCYPCCLTMFEYGPKNEKVGRWTYARDVTEIAAGAFNKIGQ